MVFRMAKDPPKRVLRNMLAKSMVYSSESSSKLSGMPFLASDWFL